MSGGRTKLIFPGLAGFYEATSPLAYPLTQFVVGCILFAHGWLKVTIGIAGVTAYFARVGMPAPAITAYCAIFIETVGAACVAIGLFTRFFAAILAIEMLVAMFVVHWASGFFIFSNKIGYEYVLLLGIVFLAIAIRGGGPYSVDAKIGKEL